MMRRPGRVRIGPVDPSVTGSVGLVAVNELVDRLGTVGALGAGIGRSRRGLGGWEPPTLRPVRQVQER
jgi:hypothetical protein